MKLRAILSVLIVAAVMIGDQVIKYLVKTSMCLYDKIEVTSWFYIFFTENHGMAFGLDFIATGLLTLLRIVAVIFFAYYLIKKVRTMAPVGFIVCLALIIAGAAGNIIDNCFYGLCFTESLPRAGFADFPAQCVSMGEGYAPLLHGHVVDMFYFPLFQWPDWMPFVGGNTFFGAVFNLADAAISCGAAAMILFYYRYVSELLGASPHPTERKQEEKER